MIDIKDKKDCCGCNACGDVCPKGAISFAADDEGFLYPKVDPAKCIKCGLCLKACPQIHADDIRTNEFKEPKCFVAVHKNLATRFDSTSGGAFSALANVIYRQGGYVGGAIWTEDFHITQYISDNKSDLPHLRSSKYAQSDAQGFYKAVKEAVKTGKPVMICGTPCQMVAMRLVFGGEVPENLYIVDFICRGNNSPLVWRKYLDWQEERIGSKVAYVKPKNKELGWRNLTTKIGFKDKTVVYDTKGTSYFTKGYLNTNAYCRPSCYACKYKRVPRYSDISLADCWGAKGKLPAELDRDLGTSLVMVNNTKGEILFTKASESMNRQEISWTSALAGNQMLVASLPSPHCNRSEFFKVLNNDGFKGVIAKYLKSNDYSFKARVKILVKRLLHLGRHYSCNPIKWLGLISINGVKQVMQGSPLILPYGKTKLELNGVCEINGDLRLGGGIYKAALRNSGVSVAKGGRLVVNGTVEFWNGADIEVFKNGELILEDGVGINVGANIVCAHKMLSGKGVKGGRNITIRDNNGGHWMNLPGYKDCKPVEIGDHVWLCEGCTIMPGVKIGAGAVVGAKAVVFNNVPPNAMVMGNPAEVVCEQVEWKY